MEIRIKSNQNILYLSFIEGKPDPPSKPTVSDIKPNQMRVSWTPPDFDGGTPIVGYFVEYRKVRSTRWTRVNLKDNPTRTNILFDDLEEKTQYQFRVSAENQIGLGSWSLLSDLYKTLGR